MLIGDILIARMAKRLAASKVFNLHDERGLAPLHIQKPECRPGINQTAAIAMCKERAECTGFTISIRANDHKICFSEAFGF